MKDNTTTDQLKTIFQLTLDSNAKDWKRVGPKSKNAEGQWVRDFENTVTGQTLTVTQTSERAFSIRGKDVNMNVSLPENFNPAAWQKPVAEKPVVDQIMDIVVKGRKDVPEALLKKADRKELSSRFIFTVIDEPDMGGVMAIVTPKGYDDEYSKKSYNVMEFLFPKAEYIDDSVYGMWQLDAKQSRAQLGTALAAEGMEWEASNKAEVLAVKAKPASKNSRKLR